MSDTSVPPSSAFGQDPAAAAAPVERITWYERKVDLFRHNFVEFFQKHRVGLFICSLIFVFFLALFWTRIFIPINAGEAGVLFRRFGGGTVIDRIYGEGFHVIFPWNRMTVYNVRVQERTTLVEALSSNGLKIHVTVSMRFLPQYILLPHLHQKIGPNYVEKIVLPEVIESVRGVIGGYRPEELYTAKISEVSHAVLANATRELTDKYLRFDNVVVRKIELPALVVTAIENKLTQEQLFQEYEFRIPREKKEAERKLIEAEGIRAFQEKITSGLTDTYLRYRGVEATLDLAKSHNAKVIVIGGKDGMPLILNPDSTPPTSPPPIPLRR
ncbi:MAG TPA: prohibitin family protein [Opitutus sp.]|nr:prohibitin family protein [Opitutus sp.]